MKFKSIKTGEVFDCWYNTPCEPKDFGGCKRCPIHKLYDRVMNRYAYCGEIVAQYPEAARLIGYEPVYDTPQPSQDIRKNPDNAKHLRELFGTIWRMLEEAECDGVDCEDCPWRNIPYGCGQTTMLEDMEHMQGASELKED